MPGAKRLTKTSFHTEVSTVTVLETAKKMIDYSHGNLHDINHFMKVYAYAKMIAEGEQLDPDTQKLVEMTALVHDIACPLCRVKYGNTNGKNQEKESAALIAEFFKDTRLNLYWYLFIKAYLTRTLSLISLIFVSCIVALCFM